MNSIEKNRQFLRSDLWEDWQALETDQKKGMPSPPVQKPYPDKAVLVDLVASEGLTVGTMPLIEAIKNRKSRRKYTGGRLTLEELSSSLVDPGDKKR